MRTEISLQADSEVFMKKSYAVLGLGRFGRKVAEALIEGNADVIVADRDPERVNSFQRSAANAIIADLSDEQTLRSIGLGDVDTVIITMGESLESSIMAAMVTKELGVKRIIAKASSKRMADILLKVGADEIVFPEEEAALRTAKSLLSNTFLDYYDLGDRLSLVEMYPKKAWVGRKLRDLNLRSEEGYNVVAIREKGGSFVCITGDTVLTETSEMLIVAEKAKLKKLDKR